MFFFFTEMPWAIASASPAHDREPRLAESRLSILTVTPPRARAIEIVALKFCLAIESGLIDDAHVWHQLTLGRPSLRTSILVHGTRALQRNPIAHPIILPTPLSATTVLPL